jgi:hypothetical protein
VARICPALQFRLACGGSRGVLGDVPEYPDDPIQDAGQLADGGVTQVQAGEVRVSSRAVASASRASARRAFAVAMSLALIAASIAMVSALAICAAATARRTCASAVDPGAAPGEILQPRADGFQRLRHLRQVRVARVQAGERPGFRAGLPALRRRPRPPRRRTPARSRQDRTSPRSWTATGFARLAAAPPGRPQVGRSPRRGEQGAGDCRAPCGQRHERHVACECSPGGGLR